MKSAEKLQQQLWRTSQQLQVIQRGIYLYTLNKVSSKVHTWDPALTNQSNTFKRSRFLEEEWTVHAPLTLQKWICLRSSMRFRTRSARQRGDWCRGSSKKEKVKLREKLRLVTGCSGGRRGGRGNRRWGIALRLARNPLTPEPAETERDGRGGSEWICWEYGCH